MPDWNNRGITPPPTTRAGENAFASYMYRQAYDAFQRAIALWQEGKIGEAFKAAMSQPGVNPADYTGGIYDRLFSAKSKEELLKLEEDFYGKNRPEITNWISRLMGLLERGENPAQVWGPSPSVPNAPAPAGNVINELGGVGNQLGGGDQPLGRGGAPINQFLPGYSSASAGSTTYGVMNDGKTVIKLRPDGTWEEVMDPAERQTVIDYSNGTPGTYEIGGAGGGGGAGGEEYPWGYEPQYRKALGLGAGYLNPAGTYKANLFGPAKSTWENIGKMGAALQRTDTPSWAQYLTQITGNNGVLGNIQSGAAQVLQQLLGMGETRRMEQGYTYEPEFDPWGAASYEEGKGIDDLQRMALWGLMQKYGPFGARQAASRIPHMQQQWLMREGAGTNFIDYLRSKLGL